MAQFPDNVYTPRETENLPGVIYDPANKQNFYSEDFQNQGDEIEAIETFLNDLPTYKTYCKAFRGTSVQSILGNNTTKVQLNSIAFDTMDEFDNTTNFRFTVKQSGFYEIITSAYFLNCPADTFLISFVFKNNVVVSKNLITNSKSGNFVFQSPVLLYLTEGDYLEFFVRHDNSSALDLQYGEDNTSFSVHRVS